jgi:hypothetical protein
MKDQLDRLRALFPDQHVSITHDADYFSHTSELKETYRAYVTGLGSGKELPTAEEAVNDVLKGAAEQLAKQATDLEEKAKLIRLQIEKLPPVEAILEPAEQMDPA